MNIEIRTATKADLPYLLELYKELNPSDPSIDIDKAMDTFEKSENNDVIYFTAVYDGRIVGTCYIAIIPNLTRNCSSIGYVENVVTVAGYRRMGIGRKLFEAVIQYAKSRNCYKITLSSGVARSEAHGFYETLGFDGNSKRTFEMRF
jgi:GNAT superfamily N-acetyltransferase